MTQKDYTEEQINDIRDRILTALEQVIDPELGIDIVNLGLIYAVDLDDDGLCTIDMTLTTMGCPLSDMLSDSITETLLKVDEVKDVKIKLVWYPAWDVSRMSRYARIALGIKA